MPFAFHAYIFKKSEWILLKSRLSDKIIEKKNEFIRLAPIPNFCVYLILPFVEIATISL